ncbi:MAG: transketolase [Abditibacteriota bacterium]|nr:transketolase [Abditibacteriota bacterium]
MTTKELAWKIRRHGIEMTHISAASHIGSVLSVADIIAVLYNDILNIDPKNPKKEDRDRFILSKGHAAASVYAALAEKGFFDVKELKTFYSDNSKFLGHISKEIDGVEFSSGSLGHGLPVAAGLSYVAKKENKPFYSYVVMGDGECDEGSVWEAALFAHHFKLDNLVAIIDYNKMQSLTTCEKTISLEPFGSKWKAFGWNVIECDGHNIEELKYSLSKDRSVKDKPTLVIANTVKGKGVSFMENNILWHYRYPHEGEEYDNALKELRAQKPDGCIDPYEVTK